MEFHATKTHTLPSIPQLTQTGLRVGTGAGVTVADLGAPEGMVWPIQLQPVFAFSIPPRHTKAAHLIRDYFCLQEIFGQSNCKDVWGISCGSLFLSGHVTVGSSEKKSSEIISGDQLMDFLSGVFVPWWYASQDRWDANKPPFHSYSYNCTVCIKMIH